MRTQKGGVARFTEVGQSSKQQKTMEVAELSALSSSKASDFEIQHVLGSGQNGLVVAAKCLREGLPNPDKLYAVKLLFNFTHEYSSVVRNAYENEWLILSRLLPHENIIRFWAQFISPIPDSFAKLLSPETRKHCTRKNRSGQVMATKGQFLVLDYHPYDLETWILKLPQPTEFDDLLKFVEQILEGVLYLEKNSIRHLDLKMSNILVTEDEKIVLCDFGCAVQLSDRSLTLPLTRGMLPGGNRAHLAPEILNTHHSYKRNPTRRFVLNYSKQTSFAVGALIYEMALREHPLVDYPLGYTNNELVSYAAKDLLPLPASYPKSFCSIVSDMLNPDTSKRLSIEEALNQLRVCCIKKKSRESMTSLQVDLDRVKRERELAKAKLHMVATERDFAVSQMKDMAEQMQTVAEEFKSMADHCDQLLKELEQVRKERDSAVKACESAFEAGELLKEQVVLLMREKQLAEAQIEELRTINARCQTEERIQECGCCHKFYIEVENEDDSCYYHIGVS